jgi:predicted aconitase with swiveling domain
MGGMCLMGMKAIGVGPEALLFSKPIDTLAAAGVLMAEIWKDQRIVTIDMLGDEFLETVQMGDPITIYEDGTVEIG